jgi:hypothetical protein
MKPSKFQKERIMNHKTRQSDQIALCLPKLSKARLFVAVFGLALYLAAAYSAKAQHFNPGKLQAENSPCGNGVRTRTVTYFPISGKWFSDAQNSRTDPDDPKHEVELRGSLHFKGRSGETLKDRPVLIFNHGHEESRTQPCEIIKFFTDEKWVVFTPLRRGHYLDVNGNKKFDEDTDIRSTGIHVDVYVQYCSRSVIEAASRLAPHLFVGSEFCRPPVGMIGYPNSAVELDYLNEQRFDVREQIDFIKSLAGITIDDTSPPKHNGKLADPARIVILGHSYGGALTVFANAYDYGQLVAIDIQGAELSWTNDDEPYWSLDLQYAMHRQQRPIFLLQPRNGKSLEPTKVLFGIAATEKFRSQAAIFPNAACSGYDADGNERFPPCNEDVTPEVKQIHGTFIGHKEQVARWGPAVIDFANRLQR